MPQVTHEDRCMIEAEGILWAAVEVLKNIEHAGSFESRVDAVRKETLEIAKEMRTYNDQFEEDE